MKTKKTYIALALLFTISLTGCQAQKNNDIKDNNTEEFFIEENSQTELGENTFFYYEEEQTQGNTNTSFGDSKFGYMTLSSEYKAENISSLFDADMYYIATSQSMGVSFLSSEDTLENILKENQNLEGYIAEKEEIISDTLQYKTLKIYGKNDKGNYYGTGFIYNKNTTQTIIISIVNFVEMDYESFKSSCEEIFKSHSYGLF